MSTPSTAQLPGRFITIEGVEGVGKSTAAQFICDGLAAAQYDFTLTREPGGTKVGESIRDILLHQKSLHMQPSTECLLMFAARAEHIATVIEPALAAGRWVVCDRFLDATYAYQGGGREMGFERIDTLANWLVGPTVPDKTFLLDAPVEVALARAKTRSEPDRIESEAHNFFERVRAAYLARAKASPERYILIDSTEDNWPAVEAQLKSALDACLKEWST